MKNKLIILLIALGAFISTNAQLKKNGWYYIPLPLNDSAEWCVVYQDGKHDAPEWRSFRYYKTLGDTFINGFSYKKVWTNTKHHKYYPTDTLVCMYRQDTTARRVYVRSAYSYYPDTNEYLSMNFGVHRNDTVTLPIFTSKGTYENRKFYVAGVDSAKVAVGNTHYYGRITYGAVCTDTVGLVWADLWFPLYGYGLMEGVGSTQSTGPFFYPIARRQYLDENSLQYRYDTVSYLHCLEYNGSLQWIYRSSPQFDYCDNALAIAPLDAKKQSAIFFPNPCQEYLDIYFDEVLPNIRIELIDMAGRMIWNGQNNFGSKIRIETSMLVPGIYLLHIFNSNNLDESYKIIKK